jgi:hypothetical protein
LTQPDQIGAAAKGIKADIELGEMLIDFRILHVPGG